MPLMTPFHHSQFHYLILMEIGQITLDTFLNMVKNHDPSTLQVKKSNRMKYDTQRWSHMPWHIIGKTFI